MSKFWDDEWPNLNDVSVSLDVMITRETSLDVIGAVYVLHKFIGTQAVNCQFATASDDPKLSNDKGRICAVLGCRSPAWNKIKDDVLSYFDVTPDFIRIKHRDWVKITKDGKRKPLPVSLRQSIMARDGSSCVYCGCQEGPFHIDHVIPVAKGGTDDPANLTVACAPCNLSKSDKLVEEWQS